MAAVAREWVDDLHDAFVDALGEEPGVERYRAWRHAFPPAYQDEVAAVDAVRDVDVLEHLDPDGDLQLRLEPPNGEEVAHIKLYRAGGALVLSDVMPLLEHLGVTVVDEHPYEIAAPDGPRGIYSFGVVAAAGDPLADPATQTRVADVFLGVWAGTVENDGLNRLVLHAGLEVRDVVIVRALCQYLRQAGVRFTDAYLADTLHDNAEVVRLIVALLPRPARSRACARCGSTTRSRRASTTSSGAPSTRSSSLDADRILRALWQVVRRDGPHQRVPRRGRTSRASSIPTALDFLPRPKPQHEIWVASPSVEGVHLRAGDIARGGIRWSDRREDFRTEVLGLMKAQTVKNAVIVPVGAKGGFYVKRGDSKAGATRRSSAACSSSPTTGPDGRTAQVVPPPDVVRRDGDDPYLVVAADKGTGAFSDVANALAAEYGYWLGDAFASGGSAGFDHKEMGITSRGAWLSVKAHFRAARRRRRHRAAHRRRHRRHVGRRVRQRSPPVTARAARGGVRPPPRVRRPRSRSGGVVRRASAAVRAPRPRRGPTTTPRCSRPVAGCTRAPRSRSTCRTRPAACSASASDRAGRSPPTRW